MYSYVEEWQHAKQNNNSLVSDLRGVGKRKFAVARSWSAQQSELFQTRGGKMLNLNKKHNKQNETTRIFYWKHLF